MASCGRLLGALELLRHVVEALVETLTVGRARCLDVPVKKRQRENEKGETTKKQNREGKATNISTEKQCSHNKRMHWRETSVMFLNLTHTHTLTLSCNTQSPTT